MSWNNPQDARQREYMAKHGVPMLLEYVRLESRQKVIPSVLKINPSIRQSIVMPTNEIDATQSWVNWPQLSLSLLSLSLSTADMRTSPSCPCPFPLSPKSKPDLYTSCLSFPLILSVHPLVVAPILDWGQEITPSP